MRDVSKTRHQFPVYQSACGFLQSLTILSVSCPSLKGDGYYYYSYNPGLQPQDTIYRIHKDKLPQEFDEKTASEVEELYFDCNRLSDDATAALGQTAFSKSGKY